VRPAAKGWCPGAHRPMESGDGLIVRLRPPMGRLTAAQALAACEAALRHGNGTLEATRRANLQIRGVRPSAHAALIDALRLWRLIDADPEAEARRNVVVDPLWEIGDDTDRIARRLARLLPGLPDLPAKFGWAVDAGDAPRLQTAPADIRIERAAEGRLVVRLDGVAAGTPTTAARAAEDAARAARWFVATGGAAAGRMARHVASLDPSLLPQNALPPLPAVPALRPGPTPIGTAVGAPFGQMRADALARLVIASRARAVRLTPWRLLLLEGGAAEAAAEAEGFSLSPDDPLLRADACPGAPACAAATVETRRLARALAARAGGALHVSGCAKGCARSGPAALTLVGRDGRFDLVRDGRAWETPAETGLDPETILQRFGGGDAPQL
jgi:precorrin-3B synthase